MSKAYDREEWDFLELLLQKMKLPLIFAELVMKCVTMVEYSVILNGSILPSFKPKRGLRQGDPLSPYLFVLVSETVIFVTRGSQAGDFIWGFYCC